MKPRLLSGDGSARLQKRSNVTIAIGALFEAGAIVCSDTKVQASDGATSIGIKQFLTIAHINPRMYVIADASGDALAAKMLKEEISAAISDTKLSSPLGPSIKKVMEPWYNSYQHNPAPQVQFLIAVATKGWSNASLYFCEPPSTVAISRDTPIVIGQGARPVEHMSDILRAVAGEKMDARSALLRVAYLMHIAKRDEGSACGFDSFAALISTDGGFTFIDKEEMIAAEQLAKELDKSLKSGIRRITGTNDSVLQKFPFPKSFDEVSEKLRIFDFPSLKYLEKKLWKKKPSTSA